MSIEGFGKLIAGFGTGATGVGRSLADRLGVPFYEDRTERCLGCYLQEEKNVWRTRSLEPGQTLLPGHLYRYGDSVVDEAEMRRRWSAGAFPDEQLTEEAWTHDHWPDTSNDIPEAVAKLSKGVTGIYYHGASMNLVLLGADGARVGIRVTAFMRPGVDALDGLKRCRAL